ncbi:hypothetical protein PSPO01_16237 [Paraphaeosphaeria sporulosa]
MDLFTYYARYQVLVCKPCACAVVPLHLASQIKKEHAHEVCHDAGLDFANYRARQPAVAIARRLQEKYNLLDPKTHRIPVRPKTLPDLKLYRGYRCSRCEFVLSKTKSAEKSMEWNFNQHRLLHGKRVDQGDR